MEKEVCNICYIRIEKEADSAKGISLYKLNRMLPYEGGSVRLFFGVIKEREIPARKVNRRGKETGKYRRKKRNFYKELEAFVEKAQSLAEKETVLFVPSIGLEEFWERKEALPMPLFAVCLKNDRERIFLQKRVCLSLPEDAGELLAQEVIELFLPYLSKINELVICGQESQCADMIEAFCYEEYGILTSYVKKPVKSTLWLDFRYDEDILLKRYAAENGIYHLNYAEVLKFLDTITKNGYNTEVN